jgi:hypothetical protein
MKKLIFIASIALQTIAFTQSSMNSSGGDISNADGSVAFSIGIPVYTNNEGVDGSIAQGVQHTYDVEDDLSINENALILMKVYPNPSSDFITLEYDGTFEYQVLDSKGALIMESGGEKITQIDMSNLASATYYIMVTIELKTKSFKIIKK